MEQIVKIQGIIYSNAATGFYILRAVPVDRSASDKNITVKGTFPGVTLGPGLKVKFNGGKYEEHPTYGQQYHAAVCEVLPEKGRIGIITYLSTHVPSVGPITAAKLYDAFGDDLVQILETEPTKILELEFLTSTQAKMITEEWRHSSESRTVAIFLTDLGLTASQIKSVYTVFGGNTKAVINSNPYRLYECPGVGFQTADSAARRFGIDVDDPRRVCAMILFILDELSRSEGHTYCTSQQILDHIGKMFRRNNIEPFSHGEYLSESAMYVALQQLQDDNLILSVNDHIFLMAYWQCESGSAECLAEIIKQEPYPLGNLQDTIGRFESNRKLTLSEEQQKAFSLLDRSRVCVISGYPGTGKTLLMSAFVYLFEEHNLNYVLLSPTGIAAKRLSQLTGRPASTIHRALGYGRDGTWEFGSGNKYYVDAVIVDETSMLDCVTFYHLLSALPSSVILILVGDSAQLPSVGAGYVLHNLMESGHIPHVSLTQIYRQEGESDIIRAAHSILASEDVDISFHQDSEFIFLNYEKDKIIDEVCKATTLMKGRHMNFQVMAPMYDGDLGINNFNRRLREVLNPDFMTGKATKLKHGTCDLYEGDRVMVIRNDYDRMIFNGDVGKVHRISIKEDKVEIRIFNWFDAETSPPRYVDKIFTFNIDETRSLIKVAYACSIHRSQGQEFDYVLIPITMQYGPMLYKNLIYTAITRAKRKVLIFGDPKAFTYAVKNDRQTVRNSQLTTFISEFMTTN